MNLPSTETMEDHASMFSNLITEIYLLNIEFDGIKFLKQLKQECIAVGCVPPAHWLHAGGFFVGGLPAGGSSLPEGVSLLGGLHAGGPPCPAGDLPARGRGVSLPGGGGSPCQGQGVSLPGGFSLPETQALWTEFLTHAYENITLPQTMFAGGNKLWIMWSWMTVSELNLRICSSSCSPLNFYTYRKHCFVYRTLKSVQSVQLMLCKLGCSFLVRIPCVDRLHTEHP